MLNAVNLVPMDSNGDFMQIVQKMCIANNYMTIPDDTLMLHLSGFSDPFVQLSLEPSHIFPEVEPRCTQIKSRDLNPLFDEVFDL